MELEGKFAYCFNRNVRNLTSLLIETYFSLLFHGKQTFSDVEFALTYSHIFCIYMSPKNSL